MANLLQELSKEFVSGDTTVADPVTFMESAWGLGIELTPVQRFVIKCFYGMPLERGDKNIEVPDIVNEKILYRFDEAQFLDFLYQEGRCSTNVVEGRRFQNLVFCAGRRSGKSSISAAIADYEFYKLLKKPDPSRYYNQTPGDNICVLNVSPTDDQSEIVFQKISNFASRCPYIKERFLHQTQTYFELMTDEDKRVASRSSSGKQTATLKSISGGCSSNGVRGQNAILIIMDEMAFFIDNDGRFSGNEVYDAIEPSRLTFGGDGRMICISSPYAKFGKFYELYSSSFGDPKRNDPECITIAFKMYSAMVNAPRCPCELLKAKRREDRRTFMREYGAEFSDSVTTWIEDREELQKCVLRDAPSKLGNIDEKYYYGIDLGFKNDGSAISIVHRDRKTDKIVQDYSVVWFSGSSDVWEDDQSIYKECDAFKSFELIRMQDILDELERLNRRFPACKGSFDQHNGYALAELLKKHGLNQFEMVNVNDTINSEIYQLFKRLYSEELLDLYANKVLLNELVTLESETRSKGKILVRAPLRKGAHDDISDSMCRAIWTCYNDTKGSSKHVVHGGLGPARASGVATLNSYYLNKYRSHGSVPHGRSERMQIFGGSHGGF